MRSSVLLGLLCFLGGCSGIVLAQRPKVEPTVENFRMTATEPVGAILYRLFQQTRARYELKPPLTFQDIRGTIDMTKIEGQRGVVQFPKGTTIMNALRIVAEHAKPPLRVELENGVFILSPIQGLSGGSIELERGDLGAVRALTFAPNNQMLAGGDDANNVVIWDMNQKAVNQFKGVLAGNAFTGNGSLFLYGSGGYINLCEPKSGKVVFKRPAHAGAIVSLALSGDGRSIVTSGRDNFVRVTQLDARNRFVKELECPTPKAVFQPCIHPNGKAVAGIIYRERNAFNADNHPLRGSLLLWKPGEKSRYFTSDEEGKGRWKAAAFSPDGKTLVALNLNRKMYLFDGETLELKRSPVDIQNDWQGQIEGLRADTVFVTFTNDSRNILVSGFNNRVFAYDIETGAPSQQFTRTFPASDYSAMTFSPNGEYLATGEDLRRNSPDKVKIWNMKSGTFLFNLSLIDATTTSVAFCPTKLGVLATAGKSILLWDFVRGKRPLSIGGTAPVVFSPDGKMLLTQGRGGEILCWDVGTGNRLQSIPVSNTGITQMLYNPQGTKLAVALYGKPPVLMDAYEGKILTTLSGLPGTALNLQFSPDGRLLSAVSEQGQRIGVIWDAEVVPQPGQDRIVFKFETKGGIRNDAIALGKECFAYEKDEAITFYEVREEFGKMTLAGSTEYKQKATHPILDSGLSYGTLLLMTERVGGKIHAYQGKTGAANLPLTQVLRDINGFPFLMPRHMLMARRAKSLQLCNLATGQLGELKGSQNVDSDVIMDAEGKLGATLGGGVVTLWRFGGGRMGELLTLVAVEQDDFLAFIPNTDNTEISNYYWASPGAVKSLRLRRYNNVYPFEQFELVLNRQDIVLRKVGLSKGRLVKELEKVYQERLRKMNLTEAQLRMTAQLPEVEPLSFATRMTENRTLDFTVEAQSYQENITHLEVRVNGVPIEGVGGRALGDRAARKIKEEVHVELRRGENQIDVAVRGDSGMRSYIQTQSVVCTALSSPSKIYAVLIGVSKHPEDSKFNPLEFADKDARDMAKLLAKMQVKKIAAPIPSKTATKPVVKKTMAKSKQRRRTYTPYPGYVRQPPIPRGLQPSYEQVKTLVLDNSNGTREAIVNQARQFLSEAGTEDLVLVFVAGHGWRDTRVPGQPYYFACYGAKMEDGEHTGISFDDLEKLMDNLKAYNKLMLLDTCNSGEPDDLEAGKVPAPIPTVKAADGSDKVVSRSAGNGMQRTYLRGGGGDASESVEISLTERMKDYYLELRHGTGTNMISAASAYQSASEGGKYKNGHFTFTLLQGIGEMKADINKDGVITVSELREYVGREVTKISGGKQKPMTLRENISNDFIIAGRPSQP